MEHLEATAAEVEENGSQSGGNCAIPGLISNVKLFADVNLLKHAQVRSIVGCSQADTPYPAKQYSPIETAGLDQPGAILYNDL